MTDSLQDWLDFRSTGVVQGIEPGLERCVAAAETLNLYPNPKRTTVVTVAGTNGKGSTSSYIAALAQAAGKTVGLYQSPHLLRYNERIQCQGAAIGDADLTAAFARVGTYAQQASLTLFEFDTLVALAALKAADLDVWVLEVGMGGRLDAVNLIDANVAVITNVSIDHADWLGSERETIAAEKAGIMRPANPLVFAEYDLPNSVNESATAIKAPIYLAGRDYDWEGLGEIWSCRLPGNDAFELNKPSMLGIPLANAAAALMAAKLAGFLPLSTPVIDRALATVFLPGRFQVLSNGQRQQLGSRLGVEGGESVEVIFDVAHNPAAAQLLAENLKRRSSLSHGGRCWAVFGLYADKDAAEIVAAMNDVIDVWVLVGLQTERGQTAEELRSRAALPMACLSAISVQEGLTLALKQAVNEDRIVVFGSFELLAAIIPLITP